MTAQISLKEIGKKACLSYHQDSLLDIFLGIGGILSAAYFPIGSYLNYCFHLPGVLFVTYFVPATTLLFAGIFVIFLLFDKNINLERTDEKF